MAKPSCLIMVLALCLAASPASAVQFYDGFQIIDNFEVYTPGALNINFCVVSHPTENCLGTLTGGVITASVTVASGTQVYAGTSIRLSILDRLNYCWPAVAARVTGTSPIRLQVWEYDADLDIDELTFDGSTAGNDLNTLFGFGSEANPRFLTRFEFSSAAEFSIDDLAMGLPTVGPGIPEPASWAMLIAGFGLAGATARRRRHTDKGEIFHA